MVVQAAIDCIAHAKIASSSLLAAAPRAGEIAVVCGITCNSRDSWCISIVILKNHNMVHSTVVSDANLKLLSRRLLNYDGWDGILWRQDFDARGGKMVADILVLNVVLFALAANTPR